MYDFVNYIVDNNEPLEYLVSNDIVHFTVFSKKLKKFGIVEAGDSVLAVLKYDDHYTQIASNKFQKRVDMDKVIIVTTYPESPWLWPCLESMRGVIHKYPIFLRINTPEESWYDIGGFHKARELGAQWFFLLHDTCEIKDTRLFDIVFDAPDSVALSPNFLMCMGKYDLTRLGQTPMPTSKKHAVALETQINRDYMNRAPFKVFDMSFTDQPVFEEKNGRKNMILENSYLKKYKGHWTLDMC